MFQRGRGCRASYKSACLAMDASLRCQRKDFAGGGFGYVVWRGVKAIASASSAEDAWYQAYRILGRAA
jgi:hypothetical protein